MLVVHGNSFLHDRSRFLSEIVESFAKTEDLEFGKSLYHDLFKVAHKIEDSRFHDSAFESIGKLVAKIGDVELMSETLLYKSIGLGKEKNMTELFLKSRTFLSILEYIGDKNLKEEFKKKDFEKVGTTLQKLSGFQLLKFILPKFFSFAKSLNSIETREWLLSNLKPPLDQLDSLEEKKIVLQLILQGESEFDLQQFRREVFKKILTSQIKTERKETLHLILEKNRILFLEEDLSPDSIESLLYMAEIYHLLGETLSVDKLLEEVKFRIEKILNPIEKLKSSISLGIFYYKINNFQNSTKILKFAFFEIQSSKIPIQDKQTFYEKLIPYLKQDEMNGFVNEIYKVFKSGLQMSRDERLTPQKEKYFSKIFIELDEIQLSKST